MSKTAYLPPSLSGVAGEAKWGLLKEVSRVRYSGEEREAKIALIKESYEAVCCNPNPVVDTCTSSLPTR